MLMGSVFEAFVTNPALYSAGHLVGETLRFPTTTEEVQALLKRIGVDGVRCQEYFIISFDSDILGLYDYLGEYENIDELNRRVLMALVDRILIYENHTIEIVFKYRDEYQQTLEYVLGYSGELDIAV